MNFGMSMAKKENSSPRELNDKNMLIKIKSGRAKITSIYNEPESLKNIIVSSILMALPPALLFAILYSLFR
jgi:hypothetical protein